jgi:DNA-directed RNA polymerase specialized sigma24 family protein
MRVCRRRYRAGRRDTSSPRKQARLVQQALEKISDEKDLKIARLAFFQELSFRQIAGQQNVTYNRVQSGYHRGLRQLERDLSSLL